MLLHALRRLRRTPIPALGVLLFAAILSVVLCGLQKANDAELAKYNETYHSIPVQLTVTNLSGTKNSQLSIPLLFSKEFTKNGDFERYITDLQMMCSHVTAEEYSPRTLVGITSTRLTPELWVENGADIQWLAGYSEDIFHGTAFVCIVPQGMQTYTNEETGASYVDLNFEYFGNQKPKQYTCKLRVVGTYTGGDGKKIYCPYVTGTQVYTRLNKPLAVDAIQATLRNNDDLEDLRNTAKKWFAEPNPLGERTSWEEYGYTHYPFALDIDDYLLQKAASTLQASIATNRICTLIVLFLSAAAGFLIGFLTVRSRKREIALMRTMGTPNQSVYFGFILEQMLCVVLGVALGGAYNLWQPADRLWILVVTYYVGLTAALLIFLRKNLLATIKEEE